MKFEQTAAPKLEVKKPEEERAEYIPPQEIKPKLKPKEVHEAKVILQPEIAEQQAAEKRQAEEMQEQIRLGPQLKQLEAYHFETAAKTAALSHELKAKLDQGPMTEVDFEGYRKQLFDSQEYLNNLVSYAESLPEGPKRDQLLGDLKKTAEQVKTSTDEAWMRHAEQTRDKWTQKGIREAHEREALGREAAASAEKWQAKAAETATAKTKKKGFFARLFGR